MSVVTRETFVIKRLAKAYLDTFSEALHQDTSMRSLPVSTGEPREAARLSEDVKCLTWHMVLRQMKGLGLAFRPKLGAFDLHNEFKSICDIKRDSRELEAQNRREVSYLIGSKPRSRA